MRREDVLVIGAGPSGLAAAGALAMRDVHALVVDAADDVASSWRSRYDRLRLNTTARLSGLPGMPIPPHLGRWLGRDDFVAYLESYARELVPRVELGVRVTGLERSGSRWLASTSAGAIDAAAVVVATGFDRVPRIPDWPGRDGFDGELLHSSEYRNARPYRGKDVLVVGAGTSGNEIAVHLLDGGAARVRVSIRKRQTTFPREWHGFPVQELGARRPRGAGPPLWLLDLAGRGLERLFWGDLTAAGLPAPELGLGTSVERLGHGIAVDSGLIDAVRAGRIEVVPAVDSFDGGEVVLAGAARITPDVVVAATGYTQGLEDLVGRYPGALKSDGRVAISGGETVPSAPGLFFIGFRLPVSGQLPELRRDAAGIAEALSGAGAAQAM